MPHTPKITVIAEGTYLEMAISLRTTHLRMMTAATSTDLVKGRYRVINTPKSVIPIRQSVSDSVPNSCVILTYGYV